MGQLALPPGGLIYLDTNALIYSVEGILPYWTVLQPLWYAVHNGEITVVTSELSLLEVLIKPLQRNDIHGEVAYRSLFASPGIRLQPISQQVLERAARLRATTRLRTPDAIHAATALEAQCVLFVTNDRDYRQCAGLSVTLLCDCVVS